MLCRSCGREMKYITSFGNNYDEPQEDLHRCPNCGAEVWIDYCSESWSYTEVPTEKQLQELKEKLYQDGDVDISKFSYPEDVKYNIELLGKDDKLKTKLIDNTLVLVECWEKED